MLNDWQPSCQRAALQARADMLAAIRNFFKARSVLEVETPLLCARAVTDLHIQAIPAQYSDNQHSTKTYYLQTSPEFAMKRLLAAGVGSIYQICKAFRNGGERGRRHNPEFSMLEWYRLGFDHHQLMDEMDEFLQQILNTSPAQRFSYQALFQRYLNIEPHSATLTSLKALAWQQKIRITEATADSLSKDDWLDLLMTHCIEPQLKASNDSSMNQHNPNVVMVYDYPASQAALAKIRPAMQGEPAVAERFEVYVDGVELANGYHELADADLQLQRFQADNHHRLASHLPAMAPDLRLIQALQSGLPHCAGVALGVDRLLMLQGHYQSIDEVLSFPLERA